MPFGLPIVLRLVPRHLPLNVAPARVDVTLGAVKGPFLCVIPAWCSSAHISDFQRPGTAHLQRKKNGLTSAYAGFSEKQLY
jgi:hypothetical protein